MRLLVALLLLSACRPVVPDNEVPIHVRLGGAECMDRMCHVRADNLTSEECLEFQQFVPAYVAALAARTDLPTERICGMLAGHDLIVVDADDHGAFKLQNKWVNGATDCGSHLTFLGLPPGAPYSAAAHELTHVVDCRLRHVTTSTQHVGWTTNGYCAAIHDVSTLPDDCK
jgi:hypothetical protein